MNAKSKQGGNTLPQHKVMYNYGYLRLYCVLLSLVNNIMVPEQSYA
jgi:hypothetical protein